MSKEIVKLEDDTMWRIPVTDDDLIWRMVWSPDSITEIDRLRVVSMLETYQYLLFECTQKRRNQVIEEIKRKIK